MTITLGQLFGFVPFPPILLAPLRWFKEERPAFYEQFVVPLLKLDEAQL